MTVEYGQFDRGRGMNYWQYDPVLQHEVERTYPGDRGWAEERFDEFGDIVGRVVAPNSDTIDEHGPELHRYDRFGERTNEIEYHPAQFENERLVYGAGCVADSFRAPPDRDAPASMLHHLTMDYLLAYADVGLTCPVAMTAGVALVLERFDGGHDGPLSDFYDRLTTREYDDLLQGAMFLTERQGGSDVGATETVAERADARMEVDRREVVLLERRFRGHSHARADAGCARRNGRPLPLFGPGNQTGCGTETTFSSVG